VLPDSDGDGVPDEIDGCPMDPGTSGPCPVDGGALDDGGEPRDAGSDAGADAAPGLDTGEDGPRDAGIDQADRPDAAAVEAGPEAPRDTGGEVPLDVPIPEPTPFDCGPALLVTASMDFALDKPLVARLMKLGCAVSQITDGTLTPAAAAGKSVVVVSDTVNGSLVKAQLRPVTVPVLLMRPDILDDNSLTGPTDGTDWARNSTEALMSIASPGHPLAAGFSGTISFFSQAWPTGWGKPEATAVVVGTIVGNPGRALLFGYEAGVAMTGGFRAPARRLAYPVHADGVARLNGNGWVLFDAAIRWATGK
jgi:hypothetical protein